MVRVLVQAHTLLAMWLLVAEWVGVVLDMVDAGAASVHATPMAHATARLIDACLCSLDGGTLAVCSLNVACAARVARFASVSCRLALEQTRRLQGADATSSLAGDKLVGWCVSLLSVVRTATGLLSAASCGKPDLALWRLLMDEQAAVLRFAALAAHTLPSVGANDAQASVCAAHGCGLC